MKIIRVKEVGRLGNRMLQYLLAHILQDHVPDAVIVGRGLPEFDLAASEVVESDPTEPGAPVISIAGHVYNPMDRPDIDLLPVGDPRYRFYLFAMSTPDKDATTIERQARFDEVRWPRLYRTRVAWSLKDRREEPSVWRGLRSLWLSRDSRYTLRD